MANGRTGDGEVETDPLIEDLRLIEQTPVRSRNEKSSLLARLTTLPSLAIVRSYMPKHSPDEDALGLAIESVLRAACGSLDSDSDQEAARYLARVKQGTATMNVHTLHRRAASQYPGRHKGATLVPESFIRPRRRNGKQYRPSARDELLFVLSLAIRDLDTVAQQDAIARADRGKDDERGSTGILDVRAYQLPYYYTSVISVCRFESGRVPAELLSCRTVHALADGMSLVHIGTPDDPGTLFVGGRPELLDKGELGEGQDEHSHYVIRLDPPLDQGDVRMVMCRGVYRPDGKPITWRLWDPNGYAVEHLVMGVQFADEIPNQVWWFVPRSVGRVPGRFLPVNELKPRDGYVEWTFRDPPRTLGCGIAWKW